MRADARGYPLWPRAPKLYSRAGYRCARPTPSIAHIGLATHGRSIQIGSSHGSQQEGRVKVVDTSFPGLQGWAESFTIKEEWYSLKNFSKDIHVLLVLDTDGMHDSDYRRPPYPIAWVRREGNGRVYFNAMGHRNDVWMSERFQQMLAGAIAWATGAEDAEVDANLFKVAPEAGVMPSKK
jgi:uncharacterized protein